MRKNSLSNSYKSLLNWVKAYRRGNQAASFGIQNILLRKIIFLSPPDIQLWTNEVAIKISLNSFINPPNNLSIIFKQPISTRKKNTKRFLKLPTDGQFPSDQTPVSILEVSSAEWNSRTFL